MFYEAQLKTSTRPTKPADGLQGIFTLGPPEYAPSRDTARALRRGGLMSEASDSLYSGLVRSGSEGASMWRRMDQLSVFERGQELPGPMAVPLELMKDTRAFRPGGSKVIVGGVELYTDYIPMPVKFERGAVVLETDIYQAIRAGDEFGTPLAKTAGLRSMKIAASEASAIKRLQDIDNDREFLETKQIPAVQTRANKVIDDFNRNARELESLTGQSVGTIGYVKLGINVAVMVLKFTPLAPIGYIIQAAMMIANAFDAFGERAKKNKIRNIMDAMMAEQREITRLVGYLKSLVNKRNALVTHAEALSQAFEAGPAAVTVKVNTKRFVQKERIVLTKESPFGLQRIPTVIDRVAASGLKTTQRLIYARGEDSPIVVQREAALTADEAQPISKRVAVYGGILGELPRSQGKWNKSLEPSALAFGY